MRRLPHRSARWYSCARRRRLRSSPTASPSRPTSARFSSPTPVSSSTTGPAPVRAFAVSDANALSGGGVLADIDPGISDGLRVDRPGNSGSAPATACTASRPRASSSARSASPKPSPTSPSAAPSATASSSPPPPPSTRCSSTSAAARHRSDIPPTAYFRHPGESQEPVLLSIVLQSHRAPKPGHGSRLSPG